jgi:hypothetical protein
MRCSTWSLTALQLCCVGLMLAACTGTIDDVQGRTGWTNTAPAGAPTGGAWPASPGGPAAGPSQPTVQPGGNAITPGGNAIAPGGNAIMPMPGGPGIVPGSSGIGGGAVPGNARYSALPDGRGGMNIEQVAYPPGTLDRAASLAAFQGTLYPLLRANCAGCHSTDSRAQAPIHSDLDVGLAHEYALTRVDFRHPEDSKFVVRMTIDRHNCFKQPCSAAGAEMLAAVQAWAQAVQPLLPAVPQPIAAGVVVSEQEVTTWIANDRAKLAAADAEYMAYTSLHELHNAGVPADRLNVARAGLSKALNSTARWAPVVVNPVDINGKGMVYRFDTRDYWGYNKGVRQLIFGGTDDDIFAGNQTSLLSFKFNYAKQISKDPAFAKLVWTRVKEGSKDAYRQSGRAKNITGFKGDYVELSQLVYTLSRADVYNAIMALPVYGTELETELGVIKGDAQQPYQFMAVAQAITIDARLAFRAKTTTGGFYWKTFDIFTGDGQPFVFWEHPVPKYVGSAGATARDLSLVGSLVQPVGSAPAGCSPAPNSPFTLCTSYTGTDGVQQQASEIIWDLPNGLQGYAIYGGLNQRRVDAFSFIVRDPRRTRNLTDAQLETPGPSRGDIRLFVGGSCMGCHSDGMNRASNDLRDRLDQGVMEAAWTSDQSVVAQVKQLYPPSSELHPTIEKDRVRFFDAMAEIRNGMILGDDKNVHVEPIVWSFEWAQKFYKYADTTSN